MTETLSMNLRRGRVVTVKRVGEWRDSKMLNTPVTAETPMVRGGQSNQLINKLTDKLTEQPTNQPTHFTLYYQSINQ